MGKQAFTLESVSKIDSGRVAAAFALHLSRAAADCYDRPGDPKPRTVTLQFDVTPNSNQNGTCERVEVQAQVTSKVPAHRSAKLDFRLGEKGNLTFNPDSPDNADQETFLDDRS